MPQTSRLLLLFLAVLAVSPLLAAANIFECAGGVYKANSTYEANLRRLAAILPAETDTASSKGLQALGGVGFWPNRVRASSSCYGASSCAACVAGAFREAERECPYGKKVVVFARQCTLSVADFPRSLSFGGGYSWFDLLVPALIFQSIGFAWLFFMLLQEWRDKRRASMMHCSSLPSGDV